jgi:hypothetical protein
LPATVELHDRVAVPDPVMLLGVIVPQVNPVGTVSVRLMVPGKWFSPVSVIVDVGETPASTAAGEVAVMLKSWNRNTAVAECMSGVLVPVIVTV